MDNNSGERLPSLTDSSMSRYRYYRKKYLVRICTARKTLKGGEEWCLRLIMLIYVYCTTIPNYAVL